ncbi:ATP-binding protein [Streptomyces sp. NPDC085524]|uniref:ATP-binding protein n=1 Tax=Streptomyces sp. NPDC085524 TaxID=3365728 RepID=UPI0037D42827
MTYAELVLDLGGTASTLSRYFSGERLPEIAFLERLYQAVEKKTNAPVTQTVKDRARDLYFEACRVREPRLHQVYVLQEQLEEATARAEEAQQTIWDLTAQLKTERALRDKAEAALRQLEAKAETRDVEDVQRRLEQTRAEQARLDGLVAELSRSLAQVVGTRYAIAQEQGRLTQALHHAVHALDDDNVAQVEPDVEADVEDEPSAPWWRWGRRRREMKQLHVAVRRVATELPRLLEETAAAGAGQSVVIEPIPLPRSGRAREVAKALDKVQRQAVRLAVEQAMLRNSVNTMFADLSRRSQDLIDRQLSLISELESREADQERLSSLFKLDHLATRMRRNGDNLLVLAGEDTGRRRGDPVPLLDIARAAAAEVEQYERVSLKAVPDVTIPSRGVRDVIHIFAELMENATYFSSPTTSVDFIGYALPDGRVLIEIHDAGIGLSHEDLAAINERLASPPILDVSISRRMGLFVVGRLCLRHGIRIQLRPSDLRPPGLGLSDSGGITALVMLPVEFVQSR